MLNTDIRVAFIVLFVQSFLKCGYYSRVATKQEWYEIQ